MCKRAVLIVVTRDYASCAEGRSELGEEIYRNLTGMLWDASQEGNVQVSCLYLCVCVCAYMYKLQVCVSGISVMYVCMYVCMYVYTCIHISVDSMQKSNTLECGL